MRGGGPFYPVGRALARVAAILHARQPEGGGLRHHRIHIVDAQRPTHGGKLHLLTPWYFAATLLNTGKIYFAVICPRNMKSLCKQEVS
jgi:hypothetical protein